MHLINIRWGRILADARVIEGRRAVDPLTIHANTEDSRVRSERRGFVDGPGNSDRFCCCGTGRAPAATAFSRRDDGVGHTTIVIEHDILDRSDLFTLSRLHFRADQLAGLDVIGSRACRGLGLRGDGANGQTQKGQGCSG